LTELFDQDVDSLELSTDSLSDILPDIGSLFTQDTLFTARVTRRIVLGLL